MVNKTAHSFVIDTDISSSGILIKKDFHILDRIDWLYACFSDVPRLLADASEHNPVGG